MNDHKKHWDDKFKSRAWGKYPPEDLVRFMGRNFKGCDHSKLRVLELGCGPGANLWFLSREGFQVSGIDCSPTAIELAGLRCHELSNTETKLDLRVGDFSKLPWESNTFDVVLDIFAVYANPSSVVMKTIDEINRVLKPGGLGYVKYWGCKTTGYGSGVKLEHHTYDEIEIGPCAGMGVTHFVDQSELTSLFSAFSDIKIDTIYRTDVERGYQIEEYICQFKKINL